MVTLPSDTSTRQTLFVYAALCALLLIPIGLTVSWCAFEWPGIGAWKKSTPEHYANRVDLLKYMISLDLSIIGATWFLASKTAHRRSTNDAGLRALSWAWTFLGIAILAAFVELYTNYKAYFSWGVNLEDASIAWFHRVRYYWLMRTSGMSYLLADTCFFIGAVLLIRAIIKLLDGGVRADQDKI